MAKNNYTLTKTKILSGIQCHKKLWLELDKEREHKELDKEREHKDRSLFHSGNRFGQIVRDNYGLGLDLSNEYDSKIALDETNKAINDKNIKVIYEAAFLFSDTLIRADVLVRNKDQWDLLEAKTVSDLKPGNITDISIQSFVVKNSNVKISNTKLLYINREFIYKGDDNYKNLILEKDITNEVSIEEKNIKNVIEKLKIISKPKSPCPKISVGKHCNIPYPCDFKSICEVEEKDLTKVNYEILPHLNKEIKEFCKLNKIKKLKDVPSNLLETNRKGFVNGYHKIIQKCHIDNEPWINVKVKDVFKEFKWPFYFLDFETVMQTVPIIKDTRPNDRLPFQWSVHKWTNIDEEIKIDEGSSFLKFDNQDIENEFLISLIKVLEDKGTIFVHNASFEVSLLNSLKIKTKFKKYSKDIDNIISRVADTLTIVRENFYSPLMKGKYSLKDIVKSIPTSVDYNEEDEIEGGMGAQLAWFLYTDPKSSKKDKNLQEDKLTTYCAKDTYALYDLVKYFMK